MLCNECEKNNANVHITKIINGVKTESHICEECAKKQQAFLNNNFFKESMLENLFTKENLFSMESLLAGMLNETFSEKCISEKDSCATCGMTFNEFRELGKFGCSNCISSFRDRLMPAIKSLQGYETHTGKIPKKAGGKYKVQMDIEKLKKELRAKIEQEKYEDAAVIRDKIKEMENNIE